MVNSITSVRATEYRGEPLPPELTGKANDDDLTSKFCIRFEFFHTFQRSPIFTKTSRLTQDAKNL